MKSAAVYRTAARLEESIKAVYRKAGLEIHGKFEYHGSADAVLVQVRVHHPLPDGDELVDVEQCQSCDRIYATGTTDPIEDLDERVFADEIVPAGQCKDLNCQCLTTMVYIRRSEAIAQRIIGQ